MIRSVTRHQHSVINVFQEISSGGEDHPPALDNLNAELTDYGASQAEKWGKILDGLGMDKREPIAVSEYTRTIQTAQVAGFKNIVLYPILNEILRDDPEQVVRDIIQGILLPEATQRAKQILEKPPVERLWVSHGLVIAGIREVLSIKRNSRRLIPKYGETTEFELP